MNWKIVVLGAGILLLAAAPPLRTTVRPSSETCGGATDETRGADSRTRVALAIVESRLPEPWTTAISA